METFDFENRQQIFDLIDRADDKEETISLIDDFERLKIIRKPFYINKDEFDRILFWKLRGQYARIKRHLVKNTDELIEILTKTAFSINHNDFLFETEIRLRILTALSGVGIPVASAILTLCYPQKYCVIDFRIWQQVFSEKKNSFSISDYLKYLSAVRKLADKYAVTVQKIDLAIWQYNIEN